MSVKTEDGPLGNKFIPGGNLIISTSLKKELFCIAARKVILRTERKNIKNTCLC